MGFGRSLTDYGLSGREPKKVLADAANGLILSYPFAESPAVLMAVPVAVIKSEGQKGKLTTDFAVGEIGTNRELCRKSVAERRKWNLAALMSAADAAEEWPSAGTEREGIYSGKYAE